MPARTNAFQQLVRSIEKLFAGNRTVTVKESAMLPALSGDNTEIDILVSVQQGPRTIHVAIECRDHGRRQGVPWIREIDGKRRDVPQVQHWIAASSSGFSKPAVQFAKQVGIELRTLESAPQYVWEVLPVVVTRPRVISEKDFQCSLHFNGPVPSANSDLASATITDRNGVSIPAINLANDARARCRREAFARRSEQDSGSIWVEADLRGSKLSFPEGLVLSPSKLRARLDWIAAPLEVTQRTEMYGDAPVLINEIRSEESDFVGRLSGTFTPTGDLHVLQQIEIGGSLVSERVMELVPKNRSADGGS